jgi:hypothetical protein
MTASSLGNLQLRTGFYGFGAMVGRLQVRDFDATKKRNFSGRVKVYDFDTPRRAITILLVINTRGLPSTQFKTQDTHGNMFANVCPPQLGIFSFLGIFLFLPIFTVDFSFHTLTQSTL